MGEADGDAAVIRHGVAAVAVLDRAGRLLQTQGEVMLDQLLDMNFSAEEREEPSQPTAPGRPHPLTLAGRPWPSAPPGTWCCSGAWRAAVARA